MAKFSAESLAKLTTCHPDLQVLFAEVIKYRDCKILEGHRGEEAQNAAFARGASKLRWPNGQHNSFPSRAVDVTPYPVPDFVKHGADFYYFGGFVMAIAEKLYARGLMKHRIRFGADWNQNNRITDERFVDAVHYEIIA